MSVNGELARRLEEAKAKSEKQRVADQPAIERAIQRGEVVRRGDQYKDATPVAPGTERAEALRAMRYAQSAVNLLAQVIAALDEKEGR